MFSACAVYMEGKESSHLNIIIGWVTIKSFFGDKKQDPPYTIGDRGNTPPFTLAIEINYVKQILYC